MHTAQCLQRACMFGYFHNKKKIISPMCYEKKKKTAKGYSECRQRQTHRTESLLLGPNHTQIIQRRKQKSSQSGRNPGANAAPRHYTGCAFGMALRVHLHSKAEGWFPVQTLRPVPASRNACPGRQQERGRPTLNPWPPSAWPSLGRGTRWGSAPAKETSLSVCLLSLLNEQVNKVPPGGSPAPTAVRLPWEER